MFKAEKSALSAALALTGSVVERRNTIPILSNVLIEKAVPAGMLIARLSNLDIEASVRFTAEVAEGFEPFTVPAGLLSDIVRKLPDGATISVDRKAGALSAVTVKAGRSRFELQVLPAHDFPEMKQEDLPYRFELTATEFSGALTAVGFAISTEETRYYLNGIFLHPATSAAGSGGIVLVATDGHRLAKRFVEAAVDGAMPGVIVPRNTAKVLDKILAAEGPVEISMSDSLIRVRAGPVIVTSKVIDGTFPDYVRVIPQASDTLAELNAKALGAAVDRVATVSGERGKAVAFSFAKELLTLAVSNPDAGNAEDEVSFEGQAEMQIGFNARYVADALSHMPGERIVMALSDPGAPAVLRSVDHDPENLIVLMPMRV